MRKSCRGWCDDLDGVHVILDAMLANGVQVLSVTDGGHAASPRFHVFGAADDDPQVDAVRAAISANAKQKGMSFQE